MTISRPPPGPPPTGLQTSSDEPDHRESTIDRRLTGRSARKDRVGCPDESDRTPRGAVLTGPAMALSLRTAGRPKMSRSGLSIQAISPR